MRIGIDFDNTIVCYDPVFFTVAMEQGLIPPTTPSSKEGVKGYFHSNAKEDQWTELQGCVYGAKMHLANPFTGFEDFVSKSKECDRELFIISHKTLYPFKGPQYNLHEAAKGWLDKQRFYTKEISAFFELTKAEKIQRIKETKCDFFIDDLPDILLDPKFPDDTRKILFDPNHSFTKHPDYQVARSWNDIHHIILG